MATLNTLLLDQTAWDLVLDSSGNIALARPAYAVAQDVASALRLFLGELWYDQTKGIPYFQEILGQLPPASLITGYLERAALAVSGVVSATCIISSFSDRAIIGELRFVDENGAQNAINF